jgi:hypothetical protein
MVSGMAPSSTKQKHKLPDQQAARFFSIHWRYSSDLELPRTSYVNANSLQEARRKVLDAHLDECNQIRNAIEFLE